MTDLPPIPRRSCVQAILLAMAAPAWAQPQKLAEIALAASDGLPVLADANKVRATYIDFWASWCTPCKLSFPWMNDVHEQLAPRGLRIVAIGLDKKEADARKFLAAHPARFPVALDPAAETAKLLAIQAMPTSLVIGADRSVQLVHRGFRLEDREALEAKLRAAVA
ncbi:MAG: TlpA family protein disulfide reductase [Rubrivivax sp.]|nr:TlpA family protein disulfide reductase [Rubrivivax sp.]